MLAERVAEVVSDRMHNKNSEALWTFGLEMLTFLCSGTLASNGLMEEVEEGDGKEKK